MKQEIPKDAVFERWAALPGEMCFVPGRIRRAREIMAAVQPGKATVGFSWGTVGLLDVLRAAVEHVGNGGECVLSTFQMHQGAVAGLKWMVETGMVSRVSLLVDRMKWHRSPALVVALQELSGGRVVMFKTHAKFIGIRGARGEILCMSSANFSAAPRIENYCIFSGPGVSDCAFDLWEECAKICEPGRIPTYAESQRHVEEDPDQHGPAFLMREAALNSLGGLFEDLDLL